MSAAYFDESQEGWRERLRRRGGGIALTLLVELLLILILLTIAPRIAGRPADNGALKTFQVSPPGPAKSAEKSPEKKAKKKAAAAAAKPVPPTAPPVPTAKPLQKIPGLLVLSEEDFAKSDIAKLRGKAEAEDNGTTAGDSVAAYGPGQGPNGQPLYNAEWYREPTQAELAFYIPKGFHTGAALIACQTAPNYRVENCRSLGESPPGTGLARGMREAAWQFRVLPPRKGGKQLIGSWVRIEISFFEGTRK